MSDWLELDLSSVVFAYYDFSFLSILKESNNEGVHFMYTETLGGGDYLFAFRMLMVLFRREFSFCDSLYLWEVLFYPCTLLAQSHYPWKNFLLKGLNIGKSSNILGFFSCIWKLIDSHTDFVSRLPLIR